MDILLVVRISNLRDTPPCVARGTKEKERSKHEAHDSATHAAGYKSDLYICQKDSIYALFQIIQVYWTRESSDDATQARIY